MKRLKINEVETLVGITKKNIRFYESEGLLTPRRNSENGYREYVDAEVEALLERMSQMEQEGTTFMNKQKQDTKRGCYVAPVASATLMVTLMGGIIWLFAWGVKVDPVAAPPLPLLILFFLIPAVVILGVVIALIQRIREIGAGEEDDAHKY